MEQLDFNKKLDSREGEDVATVSLGDAQNVGSTSEHPPVQIYRIHCQYCEDTNPDCMYCHGAHVEKE